MLVEDDNQDQTNDIAKKEDRKKTEISQERNKQEDTQGSQKVEAQNLEEDREVGGITWVTFKRSLAVFGGIAGVLLILVLTAFANLMDYAGQWCITKWTSAFVDKTGD